jgi:hypothetical protein
MHLSEEDLILYYYGELTDRGHADRHLADCATCRFELARLRQVLTLVDEQPVPEPTPGFERQMWARIQPLLPERRSWWRRGWFERPAPWVFAGGLAVLVIAAFVAGRSTAPERAVPLPDAQASLTDRVLLVAVVDHLDRSQMVLIELMNGDPNVPVDMSAEQLRARDLVTTNRLYRQSAAQTGDAVMSEVLDDLERVLLEIANAPADATAEDIDAIRARIATRGLLFRVRVVQSEMRERERQSGMGKGTT